MSDANLRNPRGDELRKDSKYKKYVALIDKNLSSFDTISEWADVIAFLGRTLKTLQTYPQYPEIPHKLLLAKRLAQCLNPALPSGVHQKALDVYGCIFENIGPLQLAQDLGIYSHGLFPFLQYAATSVKPQLLNLFETHYFALKERLRPCLKSLIIALLPGLEEQEGEFFQRVLSMMDLLVKIIGPAYFYQCMWLCLLSTPQFRIAEFNFLTLRISKFSTPTEMEAAIGINTSLMLTAIASSLGSKELLVQRGSLQLLRANFSLKSGLLGGDELILLMQAALSTVLRRESQLNKRLYSWLLGSDESNEEPTHYFETYSKAVVVRSLRAMLFTPDEELQVAQKPYRILHSLMDNFDIGMSLADTLLMDIITSLRDKIDKGPGWSHELLKTANMFLERIDDGFIIWGKVYEHLDGNLSSANGDKKAIELVDFLLNNFLVNDELSQTMYIPMFFLGLLSRIESISCSERFSETLDRVGHALLLTSKILQQIPENIFADDTEGKHTRDDAAVAEDAVPHDEEHLVIAKDDDDSSASIKLGSPNSESGNEGVNDHSSTKEETAAHFFDWAPGGDLLAYVNGFFMPHTISNRGEPRDLPDTEESSSSDPRADPNEDNAEIEYQNTAIVGFTLAKEAIHSLQRFMIHLIEQFIVSDENRSDGAESKTPACAIGDKMNNLTEADRLHVEVALSSACELLKQLLEINSPHRDGDARRNPSLTKDLTQALAMTCLKANSFAVVNSALSILLELMISENCRADIFDTQAQVNEMLIKLWGFLSLAEPALHLRVVQLIRMLDDATGNRRVEAAICKLLIDVNDSNRLTSYDRFGVFWRLSDEIHSDGGSIHRPMFLMLDTLRDSSPSNRRAGETWIRNNLKSFVRVLDPILEVLLNPRILRKLCPNNIGTAKKNYIPPYYVYKRSFDEAQVEYMFETMLTICRYGGPTLYKSMRSTTINKELISADQDKANSPLISESPTYLAAFVEIAIRFIQTEKIKSDSEVSLNDNIHSHGTDLLHCVISRVDSIEPRLIFAVQEMAVEKLLYCIAEKKLDLQTRLLHLLHATMVIVGPSKKSISDRSSPTRNQKGSESASSPRVQNFNDSTTSLRIDEGHRSNRLDASMSETSLNTLPAESATTSEKSNPRSFARSVGSSPVFVRALLDALSVASNRPILQHWVDFILTSLPQLRNAFKRVLLPIILCVCEQLAKTKTVLGLSFTRSGLALPSSSSPTQSRRLDSLESAIESDGKETPEIEADPPSEAGADVTMIVLLNAVERLLTFCLSDGRLLNESEEQSGGGRPNTSESSGGLKVWADYVTNVFQGETQADALSSEQKVKDVMFSKFAGILRTLLDIENMLASYGAHLPRSSHPRLDQSLSHATDRIKYRMRHLLDRLFKNHPVEMVEAMVELWLIANPSISEVEDNGGDTTIDNSSIGLMMLLPSCSSFEMFQILLDSIRHRSSGLNNNTKSKKPISRSTKLTDAAILKYTEFFCGMVNGPDELIEIWPLAVDLAKDFCAQASTYKYVFPYLLKILTIVSDKLSTYAQHNTVRLQRELSDIYQRVLDYCILIAGKSFDQGIWRRANRDSEEVVQAPLLLDAPLDNSSRRDVGSSSKIPSYLDPPATIPDSRKNGFKTKEEIMIQQVMVYLAKDVLPSLRKTMVDPDRISAVLTNLMYYVVSPILKNRESKLYTSNLDVQLQVTRVPNSYLKWKKEAWDAFLDPKFFNMSTVACESWKKIVQAMLLTEKEKFNDVLGRISTSPSTALFASRESEMQSRACMLRRITFILYSGKGDQYLHQWPSLQEKLVELMKLNVDILNKEIFLCLRVLLCRITNQHLSSFWPVLLTELIKLFTICQDPVEPNSDIANVVLAGCKFLDTLFILETEEFQVHQWLFVTETLRTSTYSEQLAGGLLYEVGNNLISKAASDSYAKPKTPLLHSPSRQQTNASSLKRPLLTISHINNIKELAPFFTHISEHVYQNTINLAKPDMEFIEEILALDILDEEEAISTSAVADAFPSSSTSTS